MILPVVIWWSEREEWGKRGAVGAQLILLVARSKAVTGRSRETWGRLVNALLYEE